MLSRQECCSFFIKNIKQKKSEYAKRGKIILDYIVSKDRPVTINEIIKTLDEGICGFPPTHLNKIPAKLEDDNILLKIGTRKPFQWDINIDTEKYFKPKKLSNKARLVLEKSRESALLAIEIFNKPLVTFKTEAFISLMINAWTKLLLAYLIKNDMEYQYAKTAKDKERQTYDLAKCLKEVAKLIKFDKGVEENLEVCKDYRDLVEHDLLRFDLPYYELLEIFQALVLNYEEFISQHFDDEFNLNTSLAIALQLTKVNDKQRIAFNKQYKEFIKSEGLNKVLQMRGSPLDNEILDLERFRVRLVPSSIEVANTKKNDIQIVFDPSNINDDKSIAVISKTKVTEAMGVDFVLPSICNKKINERLVKIGQQEISINTQTCINKAFKVNGSDANKEVTISEMCKPDYGRVENEDLSKIQYRYHKTQYTDFVIKILELINFEYKFLNSLTKKNIKYDDHKNFKSLENDLKQWKEEKRV